MRSSLTLLSSLACERHGMTLQQIVQAGAFVTVEAAWAALNPGALPVPQLRLRDVAQREVYDGESASSITCQA